MITLYSFGPGFGLPDPSPFVTKAEVFLKMAELPYRVDTTGFRKAPKGSSPISMMTARSSPTRPSSAGTSRKNTTSISIAGFRLRQRAIAWAFEKMLEDHLYWAMIHVRWVDDANFAKGPATFFQKIPAPIRPFILGRIRRRIRQILQGQGFGRHSPDEIAALGTRSIEATADFLGSSPFMTGAEPSGLDSTAFAFVAGVPCPIFDTPIRHAAERHENLKRYVGRMTARFYPDHTELAGCKAAA